MSSAMWTALSAVAIVGGVMVILAPTVVVNTNKRLSKVLVSMDDLIIRYRHIVGMVLLVVGYLCFRLALLSGAL